MRARARRRCARWRARAPPALWVYEQAAVELLLLAAQQGWRLLFSKETAAPPEPASRCSRHAQRKVAMLVVRGTTSVHDVVTDIRALPVPFPPPADGEDLDDDFAPAFGGAAPRARARRARRAATAAGRT